MKDSAYSAVILFALTALFSCSARQDRADSSNSVTAAKGEAYQKLPPEAFEQKRSELSDEQLIDVRTPAEYEAGHLSSSTLIDFTGEHFDQEVLTLDKSKPVMVYCQKGGRSSAAADRLQSLGFEEIYELDGGLTRWTNRGRPLEIE